MSEISNQTVVIVGAGQAGAETAIELRKLGHAGRIVIVGEEPYLPYKRPPLSKAYFAGTMTEEQLYVMQRANLDKANIEFTGSTIVKKIDRSGKQLLLADGSALAYDKLVLATGGRARPLTLPGADRPNVVPVRGIGDIQRLKQFCGEGKRMVIVGGGFIGLETAAVAVKQGMKVTVLEGLPRVLARVTVPEISAFFERVHREAGVDLRTSAQIAGFEGSPNVTHVVFADGSKIEADVVVVGIGLIANTELAQEAGLAIDNGIVVDETARTADPDIYAAGDCSNFPSTFFGRRLRLESVQNAMEQGRAVAQSISGKTVQYNPVPWFWSDQYDLKLQMVGLSQGFDTFVLRGDPANSRAFAAFYLGDGHLIAADTVSRPQDFMFAKKLVGMRAKIDAAKLADESVPLKDLVPAAPAA